MKRQLLGLLAAATSLAAGAAWAAPVMDGTRDALYGAPLSVQNTNTQFGNAASGDPVNGGGGSEINGVYARIDGGRLYVMVTGNLETNFNKLDVFIDSQAGGLSTINSATLVGQDVTNNGNLPGGVDGFCCGGSPPPDGGNTANNGALQRMNGLTFDSGFTADHYLTITHGFESALTPNLRFYAASAHYANLTNGPDGPAGALGIQLAPRGLPNVLRGTTGDFDVDGNVDGGEFLTWQQNFGTTTGATRAQGDATGGGTVDGSDYNIWAATFGFNAALSPFDANYFTPDNVPPDNSNVLIGPALPGLSQGQLIDKTYAFGPGGATDNAGTGAITRELEFVLPIIPGTNNAASHRNMENIIDLQMAIDNSNTAGVNGNGPYTTATTEDPAAVATGIEFSLPLSAIGNPAPGNQVKLMIYVAGDNHAYMSNQFGGTGILDINIGGDGFGNYVGDLHFVNMNDFGGDQFVTINVPGAASGGVPEPSAAVLAVLAGAALAVRRRR